MLTSSMVYFGCLSVALQQKCESFLKYSLNWPSHTLAEILFLKKNYFLSKVAFTISPRFLEVSSPYNYEPVSLHIVFD